jgi:hypothetical protein
MAITVIKEPSLFLNNTNPAIFEFTDDTPLPNEDKILDLRINSLYSNKTFLYTGIVPNITTGVFSVDISGFLLSMQKDGFNFKFNLPNNQYSIEKFKLDLIIRDSTIPVSTDIIFDEYLFGSFLFGTTDGSQLGQTTDYFYSILGDRNFFSVKTIQLLEDKMQFLTSDYHEVCEGFQNTISIWANENATITDFTTVNGVNQFMTPVKGVIQQPISANQLATFYRTATITTTKQNQLQTTYLYKFIRLACEKVVQFRFYNKHGGYSYFYFTPVSNNSTRGKSEFYDASYRNENENTTGQVLASIDADQTMNFEGIKVIALSESFTQLLQSPKIEINLKELTGNDFFIEVEITGNKSDRFNVFEYNLSAKLSSNKNFVL